MSKRPTALYKLFPGEYGSWISMRQRCLNPTGHAYANYGGRGIKIDPRWDSFENFFADMGPRPGPHYSLDRKDTRIDKSKYHYCKENCRWATSRQQVANRGLTRRITWNEKTLTVSEWAEQTGLPYSTIYARYFDYGWSAEKTLTTEPLAVQRAKINSWASGTKQSGIAEERKGQILEFAGLQRTLSEWAQYVEQDPETLRKRLIAGMSPYEVLLKPGRKHSSQSQLKTRGEERRQKGHLITHAGETLTLWEWARIYGLPRNVLYNRIYVYNWSIERALGEPLLQEQLNENPWVTRVTTTAGGDVIGLISHQGEEHTLEEWAEILEIRGVTLLARLKKGWSMERAFTEPVISTGQKRDHGEIVTGQRRGNIGQPAFLYTCHGKTQTLKEWAAELGITPAAIRCRLKNGWPPEKAFSS